MVRVNPYRSAFNSGELSPRMEARVDFGKYSNATDLMENFLPIAEGGLMRRPGTKYVAEVKDSTLSTRLRSFQHSKTQAYVVEMGNLYMRFYRDQGQLVALDTDAVIVNGTFNSGIASWTDLDTGTGAFTHEATLLAMDLNAGGSTVGTDIAWAEQAVTIDAAYDEVVHVLKWDVLGDPGDIIELQVGTATGLADIVPVTEFGVGFHTYEFTPGDTNTTFYVQFRNNAQNKSIQVDNISFLDDEPIEITTPYLTADLFAIEGPQNADTLYLFNENYPVYTLTRSAHHSWSLELVFWVDGPYLDQNIDATTMNPSAATGNGITITASVGTFLSTDVHRLIRIDNPASSVDWGYAQITGYTSATAVTADVKRAFPTANADANWALGAWSETTGFPSYGTMFQQRLWATSTAFQPQHVWASQRTIFNDMTPDSDPVTVGIFDGTTEADDAFAYEIAADEVNTPVWLSPGRDLVIGTSGGEWVVGHSNSSAQVTALDVQITRHTKHGSADVAPVRVGDAVLFVQRGKRKLREFAFRFQSDSNRAIDLTQIANHITKPAIVEMDFQHEPNSVLWTVRSDGQVPTMTYLRDEEVVGWGRQIFGGSFSTGSSVCETITTIPGNSTTSSEDREEVWVVVKRTINGATKRFIEFLTGEFESGDTQEEAHYTDSGLVYSGAATATLTGLDHLEGETVSIWGDGAVYPDEVVSSGSVTISTAVEDAVIGLKYTSKVRSLKWFDGATSGSAVGRQKRIYNVTLVILDGLAYKIGQDDTSLVERDFREVSDPMDTGVTLFTGETEINFESDTKSDPRIELHVDVPAPFTLLAWAPKVDMRENV